MSDEVLRDKDKLWVCISIEIPTYDDWLLGRNPSTVYSTIKSLPKWLEERIEVDE